MIQRIQSIYLLGSILVCVLIYFLPLGYINSDTLIKYSVCGFYNVESGNMVQFNWLLSSILSVSIFLQLIGVFLYKNRRRQAMLVQISLITILLFIVLALMYQDISALIQESSSFLGEEISFTWNIILIGISWILTYLAMKAIKKDEALIRSADRMR